MLGRSMEYSLRFPDDRSLGRLQVRSAARAGAADLSDTAPERADWVEIGEARGWVSVSAGHLVALSLHHDVEDADLIAIDQLPSDALHRIACVGARIGDQSLAAFSRQSALKELDLTLNPRVRDEGLQHLGASEYLRVLVLQGCRSLTDRALAPISRMLRLRELDLGFLPLTDASLSHLAPLTSLERLDLTECRSLTDLGIAHLAGLSKLRTLSLDQCRSIGPNVLAHLQGLSRLEELRLQGTSVSDATLDQLQHLPALEMLCLGGTNVSDIGLTTVGTLTRLRHLCLSGRHITDVGVQRISRLVNLTSLDLSQSSITDEGLAALSAMTGLERLDLGWSEHLDWSGFAALRDLPRLQHVDLSGSGVLTHAGVCAVAGLPHLCSLNLDQTNLTDDTVELLGDNRTLQELSLRSTRVTARGVERLQARLPGCTVTASIPW